MTPEQQREFIACRRQLLEQEYGKLNKEQREALFTVDGPLLILAGAGSGKTTVLVNKIAFNLKYGNAYFDEELRGKDGEFGLVFLKTYLSSPDPAFKEQLQEILKEKPAYPDNVLAITFTNKAANELKERLISVVGEEGKSIWAGTFHSICIRILRRYIERIGYSNDFVIYDTDDCKKIIKDCVKQLNLMEKHFPPNSVLAAISSAKDSLMAPAEYAKKYAFDYRMEKIAKLYAMYQQRLTAANALDFDDIIMLTVRLLKESAEVRENYQNKFRFIYVDEYQDTNFMQYQLISLLAAKWQNLTVVGDDDQSIYKFRGATIENILQFEQQYPTAKVIRLEQNYRSTGVILDSANSTIKNNRGRKGKTLWTKNEYGSKIRKFVAENEYEEGRFVADEVLKLVANEGRGYSDFAVLYRNNSQSNAIEDAMRKSGLPYKVFAGMKFYDRKEIKDAVAYLSLMANPADNLRLKRIINEPKRGIGDTTVDAVEALSLVSGHSMYDIISRIDQFEQLERARKQLSAFYLMMEDLRVVMDTMLPSLFVRALLEKTGYYAYCKAQDEADGRDRLSNIEVLVASIENYENGAEEPTLLGFLQEVALASELDALDENGQYVTMMTMHSAKGLEFPVVFLVGMEDGLFPSLRSMDEQADLEEERRLAYVAITRAKQQLYLSRAERRGSYYGTNYHSESRFVGEIPEDNIELLNAPAPKKAFQQIDSITEKNVGQAARISSFAKPMVKEPKQDYVNQFDVGETVEHATFGQGIILAVKPMGTDSMLEVAFDKVGTKKLMANYANLKKVR